VQIVIILLLSDRNSDPSEFRQIFASIHGLAFALLQTFGMISNKGKPTMSTLAKVRTLNS
jgi:hypothetical protein